MRITNLISLLIVTIALLTTPFEVRTASASQIAVRVSVRVGPPLLPIYAQPLCPGPGYIWEPGYWAYGDDGYYWVPGIWVLPPEVGLLWTPGYWGFADGLYAWHAGYWGPVVGFYGGINYGFGYPGYGFYGGHWSGDRYFYNTRVTNVNTTIVHNVYNHDVSEARTTNRVSFNGGPGGVQARPTSSELGAEHQQRLSMTSAQRQHQQAASTDRTLLASVNHGRPDVAATARPEPLKAHNNRSTVTERTTSNPHEPRSATPPSRPAPAHPENPKAPAHHDSAAPKAPPARPERAPSHPSTATPRPAPAHPVNPKAPAHHDSATPKTPPARPERAPSHPSTPTRPAAPAHPSSAPAHPARHQSQPHTAPPHPSTSHTPNARPQPPSSEHP